MLSILFVPHLELTLGEMRNSKDLMTLEKNNSQHNHLIKTIKNNTSPHLGSNYMLFS